MGKIIEEEKWLNENYSKLPFTEEQKRVAEKYEDAMDLRFTPDGESWSIWQNARIESIGILNKFEQNQLDNKMIDVVLDGCKLTIFTIPQNQEQEIYKSRLMKIVSPLYFPEDSDLFSQHPYFINSKGELNRLNCQHLYKINLKSKWNNSTVYIDMPISHKQQKTHLNYNNYGLGLLFDTNGEDSYGYYSTEEIYKIISKSEVSDMGYDIAEGIEFDNDFVLFNVKKEDKIYQELFSAIKRYDP